MHQRVHLAATRCLAFFLIGTSLIGTLAADELNLLFMGDQGHHQPERRFQELATPLAARGIELQYTENMADLNAETLAKFDGLLLYANIDRIEDAQAKALLDYVAGGKGFVPLHCATYCWRNNPEIVALMGAQFQRHGARVFSTQIANTQHPVMDGFGGFTSWDETYVHHLHNEKNRTVLEYRTEGVQAEGNKREPWTWVRTHGNGRIFYTAWGHDARTFTNPGFHNLVERGIRWACNDDAASVPAFGDPNRFVVPELNPARGDLTKLEYVDVGPKIPNYPKSRQWGVQEDPKNLMQQPLSPEQSMEHFVTPKGMRVELYADERNFQAKPIAMNWDERGRLWVCETVDYPNEEGGNRDRIRICEDTNQDGVADKFTVFAEGLSIPAAIVLARGGAIVQNGRKTIFLRDSDGDDVADESTTLIEGWGLGDTHGGVSNFRYGLDNWIWAMQGYNNSTPKYGGKQSQSFRQGFWRFKLSKSNPPKVTDLEFIRSSDNNTWGLGISEEGLIFGSTANRNPSMFVTIPNRYYERVRGWAPATLHSIADNHLFDPITENVRQVDQHGGYTAAAGHALYTARAFPKQWWNKTAFVCGPTGHLVGTFVLRRDGANYKSTSPVNLLASTDEWSAPIMAEVGPDGAVWVIDWYNFIVQHNPTPHGFKTGKGAAYESDLRDKKHGRIYRVVASEDGRSKLHKFASLADASNLELVAQLSHPSFNWRLQAQRLLVEREATDVAAALWKLLDDESMDEIGLNVAAIHALHTLKGLGQLNLIEQVGAANAAIENLPLALQHPSAGVRRNALAVLPSNSFGLRLLLQNRQLFQDADVQVRLQAILTLSDMPESADAAELVVALAASSTDPVLIDALTSAAAAHAVDFLKQTLAIKMPSPALLSISPRVAEHIARSGLTTSKLQRVVSSLGTADGTLAKATIEGLTRGMPAASKIASNKTLDRALVQAFQAADGQLRGKLLQLTGRAGIDSLDTFSAEVVERLVAEIEDESALAAGRATAASDLITLRPQSEEAVATIVDQLKPQLSLDVAKGMLDSLNASSSKSGGEVVVDRLPGLTPAMRSLTVAVVLTKPAWVDSLLKAAENNEFDLSDLALPQKQSLRSFPDRELRERAEKLLAESGGLPDADREKVLQSLMHLTEKSGKVDAGKAVFKKVCAACHQHGELGFEIGPNLTGMAVHPKEELLTHIIDPSRNVEGNFRLYKVLTVDDKVINGMLAGETRTSVTIIDSEAKKTTLPREDIVNLIASRKSVMPEGFEKQITERELVDLLEFLTDKGPYLPLPLDKVATAISTKGLFGGGDSGPDRMVFSDWKPKVFKGVPFVLTNPNGKTRPNMILLHGPNSASSAKMPKSVELPFSDAASAIHLLSGVGGWNFPYDSSKTVSMIVRLTYQDGTVEDHGLVNGVHFADYIRRSDVPGSEFAFALGNQQVRYLRVEPELAQVIKKIELVKGEDNSAPMVMAVTVERRSK